MYNTAYFDEKVNIIFNIKINISYNMLELKKEWKFIRNVKQCNQFHSCQHENTFAYIIDVMGFVLFIQLISNIIDIDFSAQFSMINVSHGSYTYSFLNDVIKNEIN